MTETIVEPQAPPEESTPAPAMPPAATAPKAKRVEHTPGGFPVVPLALSGANGTAGLVATAALAGGPAVAVATVTGAAVLGALAAHRRTKTKPATKPTRTNAPAAGAGKAGRGGGGLLGGVPSQTRSSARTPGKGTPAGGLRAGKGAGSAGRPSAGAAGRPAASHRGTPISASKPGERPSARQKAGQTLGGLAGGRAGQVAALRSASRAQTPTRATAREASVRARRQVADNQRAAKAARRDGDSPAAGKPRGVAARTLAKAMGKTAALRDKTVAAGRTARDTGTARTLGKAREAVREAAHRKRVAHLKAPAQKAARKALLRSAMRFHARRALAGILAAGVGILGALTTPLGRKLGWSWLMHPGRRLYRFLTGRARTDREARDAEIQADLQTAEADAEAQADAERAQDDMQVGDRAARPASLIPEPPSEGALMSTPTPASGFNFEELAAELASAAQSYEPENCMEILAMIENLPEALELIAAVLRILAERSDSEFPLEKVVADTFGDLYAMFLNVVDFSAELAPVFRQAHEADIARHEDPRNGAEAEKGWNV
ncbi:hypothetical protein [Streptomyces sp. RerS4]|uniref:hypothetical protein n=1 Tax=Streptomyces sp. RerS4 TaxID=2942449 RepID=UPI00201C34DB|nr:hypothetical protein [Streptomyces sp. RerS4]UQX01005.1 hypothetical protein M4D82_11030 [Streptomyces sp. RerS4]